MQTVDAIELFTAINFFVIGLSHLLQPGMWVEFFRYLHHKKHTGNIINALLALGTGSLILSFHQVWHWPKILVTLYGLVQMIKGLIYLLIPAVGIASIGKVTMEKAGRFWWAGLVMFLASIVLIYGLVKD